MTTALNVNPVKNLLADTFVNIEAWQQVTEALTEQYRLHVCHILILNRQTMGLRFHVSAGERVESSLIEAYLKHHVHDDHLLHYVINEGPGSFHTISTLPNKVEAYASDHFQQWAVPQGLVDSIACYLPVQGDWVGLIIGNRHQDVGEFSSTEIEQWNALYPSLSNAAKQTLAIPESEESAQRLQSVVETFRIPVAILNERGTICAINRSMTELIETVPNVAIEDDCVTLINKQQEKLLYISLIMTAKKVEGYDVDPEDLLEVSPDIYFGFQPLLKGLPDDQNRFNGVMVFAVGHTLIRPLPAEKLALIFGLSEKESQTAALLAQGRTIKQIAEQQSVSVNTIKFHLKSIFTKTGCTTQLSLMNLINSIPFSN